MTPIQAEDWVYLYVELASVVEKNLLEKFKHQIDVDEFIEICNDIAVSYTHLTLPTTGVV